jgi:hypothetical protein
MATKKPAKLAIGKKAQIAKLCPVTGKPMTAVKVFGKTGPSGMHWVVVDDFNGSKETIDRMLVIR